MRLGLVLCPRLVPGPTSRPNAHRLTVNGTRSRHLSRRHAGKEPHAAQFLDELKAHVPIHSLTESTAEIIARIGAEQAAKGITLPLADLVIGACSLELGYAIGTANVRDFNRVAGLNVIRL